jgi:hypothetical protein
MIQPETLASAAEPRQAQRRTLSVFAVGASGKAQWRKHAFQ